MEISIKICCVLGGQPIIVTVGGVTVLTRTAQPGVGVALARQVAPSPAFAVVSPMGVLRALGVGHGRQIRAAAAPYNAGIDDVFRVPELSPGKYDICASSPGYPPGCGSFTVVARASVLGEQISRGASGGSSATRGSVRPTRNGTPLARTGLELLMFLLLAVGLLAVGRFLVAASRRRSSS